jgi:F0F1-type ATP synthase alpha subunit
MKKVSPHRKLVTQQLYSGNMRIDLGRPMAKGNFIVFKGNRNQGKSTVALSAI